MKSKFRFSINHQRIHKISSFISIRSLYIQNHIHITNLTKNVDTMIFRKKKCNLSVCTNVGGFVVLSLRNISHRTITNGYMRFFLNLSKKILVIGLPREWWLWMCAMLMMMNILLYRILCAIHMKNHSSAMKSRSCLSFKHSF